MKVRGLTRRDLLRWSAFAGLAAACGDNVDARPPGESHTAAIFEPDSDSFLITMWGLLTRAIAVEVRAAGSDDVEYQTLAQVSSFHAAIEVSGLAPDTHYQVTIVTDDGVRMVHHVRTAPRDDDARPVRIAVSADVDPSPEFTSDLIAQVIAAAPELYVSLGDFPYTDNGPPATEVPVYRERHLQMRTDPRVRALLESVGVRAIYDDHEFRNDWDAMFASTLTERYAAAMQVWDEFFPLPGDRKYRRWRWGANLECFLLDTRRYRSANAMPDGPGKTMLGEQQRSWLVDGVRASTATFKVVFTSVPLDFGDGNDHWSSFRFERDSILGELADVAGVLFISADQHWFAMNEHASGAREIQVGPLARGPNTPINAAPGAVFRASRFNAGILDVDAQRLTVSGLGVGGEIFYKRTFTVADLTPSLVARR